MTVYAFLVVRKEKSVCVCVCVRECVGKQLKGVSDGPDIPAVISINVIFVTHLLP
jgi:hypothetical protein